MTTKKIGFFALCVLFTMSSCKKESAASIISEQDMKQVAVEKQNVENLPKVQLSKEVHDFGTIDEGTVAETEFYVTNTGKTDLIISAAKGSCGCTVPQHPKDPIKPGDSAPIKVSFDSKGKPGKQEKSVTLTTNTEKGNEMFKIQANVTPKAGISATTK
jgi:hypothetical protein